MLYHIFIQILDNCILFFLWLTNSARKIDILIIQTPFQIIKTLCSFIVALGNIMLPYLLLICVHRTQMDILRYWSRDISSITTIPPNRRRRWAQKKFKTILTMFSFEELKKMSSLTKKQRYECTNILRSTKIHNHSCLFIGSSNRKIFFNKMILEFFRILYSFSFNCN